MTSPTAPGIVGPVGDLELIEVLDFSPETPCECLTSWHATFGTGPADWLVRITCPSCKATDTLAACDGCWQAGKRVRNLACVTCGHLAPHTAFYTLIGRLR